MIRERQGSNHAQLLDSLVYNAVIYMRDNPVDISTTGHLTANPGLSAYLSDERQKLEPGDIVAFIGKPTHKEQLHYGDYRLIVTDRTGERVFADINISYRSDPQSKSRAYVVNYKLNNSAFFEGGQELRKEDYPGTSFEVFYNRKKGKWIAKTNFSEKDSRRNKRFMLFKKSAPGIFTTG